MDLTNINNSYQILEIRESSPCNTLHDVIHRPFFKLLLQYRLSSLLLCYISYLAGGMCHNVCIQYFIIILFTLSALVGFGVMALLTPVPTYVGRLMASVQEEKMKKVGPVQPFFFNFSASCVIDG